MLLRAVDLVVRRLSGSAGEHLEATCIGRLFTRLTTEVDESICRLQTSEQPRAHLLMSFVRGQSFATHASISQNAEKVFYASCFRDSRQDPVVRMVTADFRAEKVTTTRPATRFVTRL